MRGLIQRALPRLTGPEANAQNRKVVMKVLVEVRNPPECNHSNRRATLLRRMSQCLKDIDAEAIYFGFRDERIAVFLVVDVQSTDSLPDTVELLWLNWNQDSDSACARNARFSEDRGVCPIKEWRSYE